MGALTGPRTGYLLQLNPAGPAGEIYYQELMLDWPPVPEASTLFAGAFATIPLIFGFVRQRRKPSHR